MQTIDDSMSAEEKALFEKGPDYWGEAEERVARGSAYLDREVPRWFDRVEVLTLHLNSPCSCVLGQLFAEEAAALHLPSGFSYAQDTARLNEPWAEYSEDTAAVFLGFDQGDENGTGYGPLQEAWEAAITERKGVTA